MFAGILQSRRRRGRGPLLGSGSGSVAAPRSTGARWLWIYWICFFFADEMITNFFFVSLGESFGESLGDRQDGPIEPTTGGFSFWSSARSSELLEISEVQGWWWPSCDDHVTTRVGCNPLQIAREPTSYGHQIKWNHCENILWEILSFNIWGK